MLRACWTVLAISAGVILAGCGDDGAEAGEPLAVGYDEEALAELEAKQVGRYLGKFQADRVMEEERFTAYEFSAPGGPTCLYGKPFYTSVREAPGEDLLIYLQGGGACWTGKCAATKTASPGVAGIGWTDPDPELNPLGGRDVVFVSYCDGSVFSGDNEVSTGGELRHHRGLMNLSAALDIAKSRFPAPRSVALAGTSAGGYGTLLGTALVRLAYPKTRLFVFNDAGLGLTNPEDPEMVAAVKRDWHIDRVMPSGCTGCDAGRFSSIIDWHLRHDPSIRVGVFSSYEDGVIGGGFLDMEPQKFKAEVLAATEELSRQHPQGFHRFLIAGSIHTAMLAGYYDVSADGVRFTDWITAMLRGSSQWRDVLAPDPAP